MLCLVLTDGELRSIHTNDLDAQMACFDAVKKGHAKVAEVHRMMSIPSFRWTEERQQAEDAKKRQSPPESQR